MPEETDYIDIVAVENDGSFGPVRRVPYKLAQVLLKSSKYQESDTPRADLSNLSTETPEQRLVRVRGNCKACKDREAREALQKAKEVQKMELARRSIRTPT